MSTEEFVNDPKEIVSRLEAMKSADLSGVIVTPAAYERLAIELNKDPTLGMVLAGMIQLPNGFLVYDRSMV
jgi:hypothetical protein